MAESIEFLAKIGRKDYIDYKGIELPINEKYVFKSNFMVIDLMRYSSVIFYWRFGRLKKLLQKR